VHDDCDGDLNQALAVIIDDNADAHVLLPPDRNVESLRFREQLGGGMSPRVRNAILVLAEAIRRDNLDRPQQLRADSGA